MPSLLHSFILIASKFSFTGQLVDSMYKCLSDDVDLSKCEESWDVLARRHLLEENSILEKCKESGQVAGKPLFVSLLHSSPNVTKPFLSASRFHNSWIWRKSEQDLLGGRRQAEHRENASNLFELLHWAPQIRLQIS